MNQDIALRDPGAVARQTGGEDITTIAQWVVESGLFGRGITQAQAGMKMLVGRELGIPPLAALRNVYIFESKGRPIVILDGTLMGGMIRASGHYDFGVVQHDDNGTVLEAFRLAPNGTRISLGQASFTMEHARKAKLDRKEGPWSEGYARDMCYARAMSRLVDHYFPELLLGLSMPVVTQEAADDLPMEHDQRKAIFAGMHALGMSEEGRHRWASDVLGRPVTSFADGAPGQITRRDASILIDWLKEREEEAIGLREPEVAEIVQEVAGGALGEVGSPATTVAGGHAGPGPGTPAGLPTDRVPTPAAPLHEAAPSDGGRTSPAQEPQSRGGEPPLPAPAGGQEEWSVARREFETLWPQCVTSSAMRSKACVVGIIGEDRSISSASDDELEAITGLLLTKVIHGGRR